MLQTIIHQKNVTTDPDPALKHDARENDNVNSYEENEDPLNEYRAPVSETCLESVIPYYPVTADDNAQSTGKEVYSIAPGENKHPVSFMLDKQCERLAFPVLFPKGRSGYTAERQVTISPLKYFNIKVEDLPPLFCTIHN